MRNRVFSLWIVVALVVLGACAPIVAGNPVDPTATELSPTARADTTAARPATGLRATLEAPTRLPGGDTVIVQFTLTNDSDADLYVLKWYTPLEGIGGEIFSVERDGQAVPYTGILAMRGDPTPEAYQLLEAGQSASADVDLATSFDFSQPGEYIIEFLSPRISHVARSEAEMARSVDDLGPVDIPANTVTVEIDGSTGETGEPATGDELVHYQGASPFYPDALPFEITYSPSLWEYVPGPRPNQVDHLRHREIGRCFLWLEGGGEETSPVSTVSLAGSDWTISQARTNIVRPDGWVSILVRGTDPLKTLLQRLPPGEHVIWVSGKWLEQVGADDEMIGTMRQPDAAMVADIERFGQHADLNLSVTGAPSPPTPEPRSAPLSTLVLKATGQGGETGRLILCESPLIAASVTGPGDLEDVDQLGPEVLARIEVLRDRSAAQALALTNAALAPFGYRLLSRFDEGRNKVLHDLYHEGEIEPLVGGLAPLSRQPFRASVNASGTDFALVAESEPCSASSYLLITSEGPQPWQPAPYASLQPAYVGDALAQITTTGFPTITYRVDLDKRAIYTGTVVLPCPSEPLRAFTTWDDHWLLEVDDHLIMDGRDFGQSLGYDAAFGFTWLGGQPFFFFEQNGLVGISYGGQVMPNLYERVFHNACCEAVIHNPEAGPEAIWFHALRDGTWYWVEARTLASSGEDEPADDELALQSLVDFFVHLSASQYEEASQLYGGPYKVLIEYNPTLDPQDHAALLRNACTINGFQCLRVHSARLQEDLASGAEFRFLVEFSTPNGELLVRGPCCGASETDMPPESAFLFTVSVSRDGEYRVQDLPVYIP